MKYKNKKCSYTFQNEQYNFDSMAERDHFIKLTEKLRLFKIEKLKLQPKFNLSTGFRIDTNKNKKGHAYLGGMKYTPDFEYFENGEKIIVEVKGMITKDYKIRLKLFLHIAWVEFGISKFIEVINGKETVYDCKSVK